MDAETQDALSLALNTPEIEQGQRARFWTFLRRTGNTLYFELRAWDDDNYILELACDGFGDEPIRGRFVDPVTFLCCTEAWPDGNDTFTGWFKRKPNEYFICWPGDRGGIEHHSDWRALAYWKRTTNQLHQYLEFIRQCLTLRGRGYKPRQHPPHAA